MTKPAKPVTAPATPDGGAPLPTDKKSVNKRIDIESDESFPASDPPSFTGGHAIGAPKKRETPPPTEEHVPEKNKDYD